MAPHHLPDEPRPEGMPPPTTPPPRAMLTTGNGNGNVLRSELRGLDGDVREIKERLIRIEERLTALAITLAAIPAHYGPVEVVNDLRSRIDRATGGVQFLWLAVGLLVALGGLLLTARAKGL